MTGGTDKEFRLDRTMLLIHSVLVCFTVAVVTFLLGVVVQSLNITLEKNYITILIGSTIILIFYWILSKYGPSEAYVLRSIDEHDNRSVVRILIGWFLVAGSIFSIGLVGLILEWLVL
jgi:hypothetical protein